LSEEPSVLGHSGVKAERVSVTMTGELARLVLPQNEAGDNFGRVNDGLSISERWIYLVIADSCDLKSPLRLSCCGCFKLACAG